MVLEGSRCELCEAAQPGEEAARIRVMNELGPYAVLPKPNPRIEPHEKELYMATNVKKPTLRSLGIAAGVYKQGDMKVFQKELPDLIEDLKKEFPGIDEMDENQVQDLLTDVKKNGVTGGKGDGKKGEDEPRSRGRGSDKDKDEPARGRGRSSEKDEEPARGRGRGKDPEPEKKDEEPARGRGRGRAADKDESKKDEEPARGRGRGRSADKDESTKEEPARGRGRGSDKVDKDEVPAKDGPDNTQVIELLEGVLGAVGKVSDRLDAIEARGVENGEAIDELKDKVNVLRDGVECIVFGDQPEKGEKTLEDVIKRVQG